MIIPSSLHTWISATRPKTLLASIAPVLLGLNYALALRQELLLPWSYGLIFTVVLTLTCALLMQIGTNLVNDYFDAQTGVDTPMRFGPARATAVGLLSAQQVRKGFTFVFALAFFCGVLLAWLSGGIFILSLGIVCLLVAYLYTGGPYPLSHYGLGEVLAWIFFGPVAVGGTAYLFIPAPIFWGDPAKSALLLGMAPGALASALMFINNLRDYASDTLAKKTTIVVCWGEKDARKLFFLLLLFIHLYPIFLFFYFDRAALLLAITPAPFFFKEWKTIFSSSAGAHYNAVLAAMGKFLFLYCLLLGLAIWT